VTSTDATPVPQGSSDGQEIPSERAFSCRREYTGQGDPGRCTSKFHVLLVVTPILETSGLRRREYAAVACRFQLLRSYRSPLRMTRFGSNSPAKTGHILSRRTRLTPRGVEVRQILFRPRHVFALLCVTQCELTTTKVFRLRRENEALMKPLGRQVVRRKGYTSHSFCRMGIAGPVHAG
jgi:hypothetical protein